MAMICQSWVNVDVFSSPFEIGDWGPPKATPQSEVVPSCILCPVALPLALGEPRSSLACQDWALVKKTDFVDLTYLLVITFQPENG